MTVHIGGLSSFNGGLKAVPNRSRLRTLQADLSHISKVWTLQNYSEQIKCQATIMQHTVERSTSLQAFRIL